MILRQYIQICNEVERKARADWEAKPWYEHNNWVKEKVDGVGHKIDEGLKWIDKNLNPFNWGK